MKNAISVFAPLLTIFSFNMFGMQDNKSLKRALDNSAESERASKKLRSEEGEASEKSREEKSEIPSLKKLSAVAFAKGAKQDGKTLKKLIEELHTNDYPREIKDLIVFQGWMANHPIFDCLALVQRKGVDRPYSISWSPDGKQIALTSYSKIELLDAVNWTEIKTFELTESHISWSPDGKQIAISLSNRIELLHAEDLTVIKTFQGGKNISWRPDCKQIAIEFNGTTELLNTDLTKIKAFRGGNNISWSLDYKQIAINFDGKKLYSFDVKLLNAENFKKIKTFKDTECRPCSWSPDGKQITIKFKNNTVKLLNAENLTEIKTFQNTIDYTPCSWSPDGKQIAISFSNRIELLHAEDLTVIKTFQNTINPCSWSPDGKQIAISFSHRTELLNAENLTAIETFQNTINYTPCSWSPDGKQIAISFSNRTELFNTENLAKVKIFTDAFPISWSPDSNQLVQQEFNTPTKLWQKNESAVKELREIDSYEQALFLDEIYGVLSDSDNDINNTKKKLEKLTIYYAAYYQGKIDTTTTIIPTISEENIELITNVQKESQSVLATVNKVSELLDIEALHSASMLQE